MKRVIPWVLLLLMGTAFAQSIPNGQINQGQIWTPAQWNNAWQSKTDWPLYPQTAAEIAAGVTPVNYGYPVGYVDRYGTNTTPGTTVMLAAIQDAFAVIKQQGGGTVTFLPEQYYLGSFNGNTTPEVMQLTGYSDVTVNGNGAILEVATQAGSTAPYGIIQLANANNFNVYNLGFKDTNFNETVTWQGAIAWYVTATGSTNSGGITISGGDFSDLVSPFTAYWITGNSARVQHIRLNYRCVNCYYGANFSDQGDYATGAITVVNPRRAYFIYGVTGHNMTVNAYWDGTNTGGSNAGIDIKRYQYDTTGDKIVAIYHGDGGYAAGVRFETQPNTGTFGVTQLGSITGGSGYTNGVYTDVPLTGGSGTGAVGNVDVTGGAVSAVSIVSPGSGYANTDTLSAAASTIGGTGSGFSVPVSAAGGTISNVSVRVSMANMTILQQTVPVTIDALNAAGTLQTTTNDRITDITVRGDFGAWSSFASAPITVSSTQNVAGRLILEGRLLATIQAAGSAQTFPGFDVTSGATLLSPSTVSTLPTCNSSWNGFLGRVTDATSPTYNGTLTGGGAVVVPVFCNGTAWTSH